MRRMVLLGVLLGILSACGDFQSTPINSEPTAATPVEETSPLNNPFWLNGKYLMTDLSCSSGELTDEYKERLTLIQQEKIYLQFNDKDVTWDSHFQDLEEGTNFSLEKTDAYSYLVKIPEKGCAEEGAELQVTLKKDVALWGRILEPYIPPYPYLPPQTPTP